MATTRRESADLPLELIRPDLDRIEACIRDQARSFDPAVEGYVAYVCNTSGKRIRPALAILAGGACGGDLEPQRKLGVVLELIHIASLVHDDLIDEASIRRDLATANAKWGSHLTVLLGDCLFAHALTLATSFDDNTISRRIATAANQVCQGEILQTQRRFDLRLSIPDYLRIIEMKTAALFACSTEIGGALAGATPAVQESLRQYGLSLGTAYQIYDDCVDLIGDEAQIGKTLGTDLAKGKLTLPILNLIAEATETQRSKLNRLLVQNEPIDITVLAGIADYEGAVEKALAAAGDILDAGHRELAVLPSNEYTEGLEQVTRFIKGLLATCGK